METIDTDKLNAGSIQSMQEKKLHHLLQYVCAHSKFYRQLFESNNIDIKKIKYIEQLKLIPPTTKRDLQLYNRDFLCVSPDNIVEYVSTSGTMGSPVVIALTKNDLQRLAYNEFLSFKAMGVTAQDVIQLILTLDKQFMAGMAYYQGAHLLQAAVIRTGPGVPSMQWDTIFRMRSTVLVAVPSFIIKLIEFAEQNNIDYNHSPVRKILCIGENIRKEDLALNTIGERICKKWNVELYSTYASTEKQTAFTECPCGKGGHIHPELLIAEVLDEYGHAVPTGEVGELTVTTLDVEGMPLLRYRTGDLCYTMDNRCDCGRAALRISPIIGRKNHMIKYKGTTLYPPMVFEVLNANENIIDYILEVKANELGTDDLTIRLALQNNSETGIAEAKSYLHASLRVSPHVIVSDIDTIRKMQSSDASRKITRIIDNRRDVEK